MHRLVKADEKTPVVNPRHSLLIDQEADIKDIKGIFIFYYRTLIITNISWQKNLSWSVVHSNAHLLIVLLSVAASQGKY